jgi:hypothetical protein
VIASASFAGAGGGGSVRIAMTPGASVPAAGSASGARAARGQIKDRLERHCGTAKARDQLKTGDGPDIGQADEAQLVAAFGVGGRARKP